MNSRVYPTYKTKYRVANWASYDRALVGRGDVTLWMSPEAIAAPYDRDHFVRVDASIALSLIRLPAHASMTVSFDLYILKSWDGDSPTFGPDRWNVGLAGSPALLDTTFSNNFKTDTDRSVQSYPSPASAPQTGAAAVNTLGYGFWFGDATYHFTFTFSHTMESAIVTFSSSLYEGKAEQARSTRDESWGLDNVGVTVR